MYIAALPKAWMARNERSRNPEVAITSFLPIDVLIKETNHMIEHLFSLYKELRKTHFYLLEVKRKGFFFKHL